MEKKQLDGLIQDKNKLWKRRTISDDSDIVPIQRKPLYGFYNPSVRDINVN